MPQPTERGPIQSQSNVTNLFARSLACTADEPAWGALGGVNVQLELIIGAPDHAYHPSLVSWLTKR